MKDHNLRCIILYEFKRGVNAAEATRRINEVYGDNAVNVRTVQRWFDKFRDGNTDLENRARGRPSSLIDNDQLREIVEADPYTTIRELADKFGVGRSTISTHLKQIKMSKKYDKWVPNELSDEQENNRLIACCSSILRNKYDPFFERIVIYDEKWISYDNDKHSGQCLNNDETLKNLQKKIMVSLWWSHEGIIHYEYLKPGETLTSESYCRQLDIMNKKLQQMRTMVIYSKGPILVYDNNRSYVTPMVLKKLYKLEFETLPYPEHSPDLSPTNVYLFKHLDDFLKVKILDTEEAVKSAFEEFIASRTQEFYANGINTLEYCWQQCANSCGCYFD